MPSAPPQIRVEAPLEKLQRLQALRYELAQLREADAEFYRGDIAAWARQRLGVVLWSKQIEIAASVARHRRTAVRSAAGIGKCTTLDAMIPLADGTVREARELIGRCFVVQAWDEDGTQHPSIAWASDNGEKPVTRVRTTSGRSIDRTGNHPLYAARSVGGGSGRRLRIEPRGWTAVDDLAVDDLVLVPEQLQIEGQQRAADEDVKLLGYLLGDGGTSGGYVGFTQQEGPAKEEFRKLAAHFGCFTREHHQNKYGIVVVQSNGTAVRRKGSNPVLNRVREWGLLGCKATEKRFPDWAWRLPNDQLALLLNRLFACDGWATVPAQEAGRKRGANVVIAIGLANEGLIRDVEMAMLRLGINGTVRARTGAYDDSGRRFASWEWSIRRLEDMRRFRDLVGILGKEDAVDRCVTVKEACGGRANTWMRQEAPDGYRWEKITHLESLGVQPTVCISVPGPHTYLTTFVEHNSFLAAVIALWWIDTHPLGEAIVITTAPTGELVREILWGEIRQLHRTGDLPGTVQQGMPVRWVLPDGTLVGLGRKPAEENKAAFQGFHRKFVLAILDEAGGASEMLWAGAENVTTNEHCRVLAIGNPDDNSSKFAHVCQQSPLWAKFKVSAFDSPNLTGEDVPDELRLLLPSARHIEDLKIEWGETNPLYVSKVLGEFADAADGLIPLSWIQAAQRRWSAWRETYDGSHQPPGRDIFGVDVARFGEDKTAIAHRQGHVIHEVQRWAKLDTVAVTGLVEARLASHVQSTSVVDADGLGVGVVDLLRSHGRNVIAYSGGAPTKKLDRTRTQRFQNVRSAAWYNVREILDPAFGSTICLPPATKDERGREDDQLAADLAAPKWPDTTGNVIKVEPKLEIVKRLGHSPDTGDAVVQAFWVDAVPRQPAEGAPAARRVRSYADSQFG